MKDFYMEKYELLMKEIKEDTMKYIYSQIGRYNIIKVFILHKTIYMFNDISIKNLNFFFLQKQKKSNSKIHMESQKTP